MSIRRRIDPNCSEDPNAIDSIEYNSFAGAQKNIEVGPALKFVSATTAATKICPGDQLFLFKTSTGVGYVKMGDTAAVAAPSGGPAVDEFPVFGEQYTRISAAEYKYIRGAADIFLYVLKDDNAARVNP